MPVLFWGEQKTPSLRLTPPGLAGKTANFFVLMTNTLTPELQTALALAAAATAIAAVIVGPLISLRIARNRARLEAVVLERVERLRDLRKIYSEFVSILLVANNERGMRHISHAEATNKLERAIQLETEISIMITAETRHGIDVLENMTAARNRIFKDSDETYDPVAWQKHYYDGHAALLEVMRAEREKIAKLK